MATVTAFIRTLRTDKNKSVNVRFRLRDGRDFQVFHKSELSVIPDQWDEKQQKIKARCIIDEKKRKDFDDAVNKRKGNITSIYLEKGKSLTSDLLDAEIDKILYPEKYETPQQTFFNLFDEFLRKRNLSEVRERNFMVLKRALQRYELFVSMSENKDFMLDIDTMTAETIEDFESFVRNEYSLYNEYPDIYKKVPAITGSKRKTLNPRQRGHNTICVLLDKLRVFINYCIGQELTTNNPFRKYEGNTTEVYGRPVYITLDERNIIADFDLSSRPTLEAQRDIFIFQCLIGCRVSDLLKMTKANIINDAIEYIPTKTKDDHPHIVRVPLNNRAHKLIEKYKGKSRDSRLFPFISSQKYNDAIKEVFAVCGIARSVTMLNTITGKEEKRPINEIASSHMARRTFVGNLYKQVKDPHLVGALSGHKDGSKAFARYRDIDEEMKRELVSMIE